MDHEQGGKGCQLPLMDDYYIKESCGADPIKAQTQRREKSTWGKPIAYFDVHTAQPHMVWKKLKSMKKVIEKNQGGKTKRPPKTCRLGANLVIPLIKKTWHAREELIIRRVTTAWRSGGNDRAVASAEFCIKGKTT